MCRDVPPGLGTAWAHAQRARVTRSAAAAQPRTEPRAQRAPAPPPVVLFSPRDWPPQLGAGPSAPPPSAISQSHRPPPLATVTRPASKGRNPGGAPLLGPSPSAAGPFRVGGRGHEALSDWLTLAARRVGIGRALLAGAWRRRPAGGAVKGPAARPGAVAVRHGLPGLGAGVPGHAGRDARLHHGLCAHHRRRGEGWGRGRWGAVRGRVWGSWHCVPGKQQWWQLPCSCLSAAGVHHPLPAVLQPRPHLQEAPGEALPRGTGP